MECNYVVDTDASNTVGSHGYYHSYFGFSTIASSGTGVPAFQNNSGMKYRSGANTSHSCNKTNYANTYFNGIGTFTIICDQVVQWGRTG